MTQRRLELQQQARERERELARELKWPSPAAEAAWRAGLGPGMPASGLATAMGAAMARAWAATRAAGTSQGHDGNGAAQRGPDQGADAGTVGSELPVGISRMRLRDAVEGSPERDPGQRVGRGGLRGKGTRNRKLERALVDPSTALICDDLDEHGDDDEMQGPSQQVAHLLEDMAISPSLT